jgi:transaldolase
MSTGLDRSGPAHGEQVDPIAKKDVVKHLEELRVKIFADGADVASALEMYRNPIIKGFTTNPTLMRKAGITDYKRFAMELLAAIPDRPISFEVFADDFPEMERQARAISSWGENVYVKIPITNTHRKSSIPLVERLAQDNIKLNVTALMTLEQVREVHEAINGGPRCYISVFAGRIADTGRDPVPLMSSAVEILSANPQSELVWASPRELLNIFQADQINCHIITATHDILKKLALIGKDLDEYSLDTVKMFYDDGRVAAYKL